MCFQPLNLTVIIITITTTAAIIIIIIMNLGVKDNKINSLCPLYRFRFNCVNMVYLFL